LFLSDIHFSFALLMVTPEARWMLHNHKPSASIQFQIGTRSANGPNEQTYPSVILSDARVSARASRTTPVLFCVTMSRQGVLPIPPERPFPPNARY
jgi:hypothetical protein